MKSSPYLPRRGREMTRLETFTDAAFAFAVTLLAVSIDEIPNDYESLLLALKGTPAFAASFALLLLC
ncbi:MAG: TMEM175 family protein [Wenzhouxiangella sp.]|nr:TMEM175 family protein [Wenzhouxiangella sp.]